YYSALYNSPFGNRLLLDFTREAIAAEKLGQEETTDLLCISFSSNDAIGHCWGPDSQEVLDVTLRSDEVVRDLLNDLDRVVGKYLFVLTSDHGVCRIPEIAKSRGQDAGRINTDTLFQKAAKYLDERFGRAGNWFLYATAPWIYLDPTAATRAHVDQSVV